MEIGSYIINATAIISNMGADVFKAVAEAGRFVRVVSPSIETNAITKPAVTFAWQVVLEMINHNMVHPPVDLHRIELLIAGTIPYELARKDVITIAWHHGAY